ncbi:hypothetical protein ACF0H5_001226 [Mactra antiquata]
MNRSATMNPSDSTANQTRIQNFPDYLRYVMMKSMAGFGKVHTELTRLYTSVHERPASTTQPLESRQNVQGKRRGFRERWSMRESARSQIGTIKQPSSVETFTSYIEGGDIEDNQNLNALLENDDQTNFGTDIKSESLPSSAPAERSRKAMFTFHERAESMPHAELMNEAIYINDRVVYTDLDDKCETDNKEICADEENDSITPQDSSESDEYIDMTNTDIGTTEDIHGSTVRTENLYQSLIQTSDKNDNTTRTLDKTADSETDETDYDYPSTWTHDYNNIPDSIVNTVTTEVTSGKIKHTNTKAQCVETTNGRGSSKPNPSSLVNDKVNGEESDYDVPIFGVHPINNPNLVTEGDYDVPILGIHPISTTNPVTDGVLRNSVAEQSNIKKEYPDYDIPKPLQKVEEYSTNPKAATRNETGYVGYQAVPDTSEHRATTEMAWSTKPFSEYTVGETVCLLIECSLNKLADICLTKQIDGAYLCKLNEKELMAEPFSMNWFHVSRLKKVIRGWRPKVNKRVQNYQS